MAKGKFNSRAAINHVKIDSLPSSVWGSKKDVIPYGVDNLYPTRIIDAIENSPTASGCVRRFGEFVFGQGIQSSVGGAVVNRDGETLNDVLKTSVEQGYAHLNGFVLHLNFNVFGQVAEIFSVEMEVTRKLKDLRRAEYDLWDQRGRGTWLRGDSDRLIFDMFETIDPLDAIIKHGYENYKGQVFFFSGDGGIYPDSQLHSAIVSASYEKQAQVYPYANIMNGFSGTTIVKYPSSKGGTSASEEADEFQKKIEATHGAEHAGSTIIMQTPVTVSGEVKNFQAVESLTPTNVDNMFVNQNEKAQMNIQTSAMMPGILLGITPDGMFNEASFNDAFNYKNGDTEADRKTVERAFKKILDVSIWSNYGSFEITPLAMKESKQKQNGF